MTEPAVESNSGLRLDTDWVTAVGTLLLLIVGAVFSSVRWAFLLLLVGPICRILEVFKATTATQLDTAPLLGIFDLLLYAGGTIYVIWWFSSKIRHV